MGDRLEKRHWAEDDLQREALELMWRCSALANSVFERCDDSSGTVIGLVHDVCADLATTAESAQPDPDKLADRTFDVIAPRTPSPSVKSKDDAPCATAWPIGSSAGRIAACFHPS